MGAVAHCACALVDAVASLAASLRYHVAVYQRLPVPRMPANTTAARLWPAHATIRVLPAPP